MNAGIHQKQPSSASGNAGILALYMRIYETSGCYMGGNSNHQAPTKRQSYLSIVQRNVRSLQFYSKTKTILSSCALRIRQKLESVSKHVQRSFPVLSSPVLVKLVYGQYGDDVHRLLAGHNLAPQFHAASEVEGAPKAYVMEYLDPSSWKPLSEYFSLPNSSAFAASIRRSIDKVLDILRDNGKVHGDLRPINIMINVSSAGNAILINNEFGQGRATIKIVDFDWGGDAGKVFYPLLRNADIVGLIWPGKPGGPIKKTHDRRLVDSWWKESFGQDL